MIKAWPTVNTHSAIFDEGVTEFSDFGPGRGDLLHKKFSSLLHHFLTARQILTGGETEVYSLHVLKQIFDWSQINYHGFPLGL